jgi:hypothetical protein
VRGTYKLNLRFCDQIPLQIKLTALSLSLSLSLTSFLPARLFSLFLLLFFWVNFLCAGETVELRLFSVESIKLALAVLNGFCVCLELDEAALEYCDCKRAKGTAVISTFPHQSTVVRGRGVHVPFSLFNCGSHLLSHFCPGNGT